MLALHLRAARHRKLLCPLEIRIFRLSHLIADTKLTMKNIIQPNNETIRKVQLIQLDILKQLIKLFDQEGLTYFAIGGTALGAFRHNGFIPWDDDIDIAMPRADYDKFLLLQDKLPKHLNIQSHFHDKNYPLYISKVRQDGTLYREKRLKDYQINHGIFVDVFPWDAVPNEYQKQFRQINRLENAYRRSIRKQIHSPFYATKFLVHRIFSLFESSHSIFEKLDRAYKDLNGYKDSKLLGNIQYNDILHIDQIFPLQKLRFEDTELNVPNKIEEYLSMKYGNYMELPPVHKRINHNPVEIEI